MEQNYPALLQKSSPKGNPNSLRVRLSRLPGSSAVSVLVIQLARAAPVKSHQLASTLRRDDDIAIRRIQVINLSISSSRNDPVVHAKSELSSAPASRLPFRKKQRADGACPAGNWCHSLSRARNRRTSQFGLIQPPIAPLCTVAPRASMSGTQVHTAHTS
ncbi:hypothetical protein BJY00DRAFT_202324 [Aspergillus carlsbadensis]|nr:hypothetical protein BJY00DRAFT_202324 [Aspergillus carlsbadensis]